MTKVYSERNCLNRKLKKKDSEKVLTRCSEKMLEFVTVIIVLFLLFPGLGLAGSLHVGGTWNCVNIPGGLVHLGLLFASESKSIQTTVELYLDSLSVCLLDYPSMNAAVTSISCYWNVQLESCNRMVIKASCDEVMRSPTQKYELFS